MMSDYAYEQAQKAQNKKDEALDKKYWDSLANGGVLPSRRVKFSRNLDHIESRSFDMNMDNRHDQERFGFN